MSEADESRSSRVSDRDFDRAVKLGGAVKRFRAEARAAKERADAAEKRLADLAAEHDALKLQSDSSTSAKRVDELTGELRTLKHRQAFDRLAALRGVRPEALEDLWDLSGCKPEADQVDEAALGLLIDEQKAKRGYLFDGAASAGGDSGGKTPPVKPAPGGGQGSSAAGIARFTDEQMSDPEFVMRNYAAIAEASKQTLAAGRV